jgi:hypothetical protein
MGLRERVRKAIEGPVGQADELLADLVDAEAEARLEILISGWGRGLSAALEELAIAVEDLQAQPAGSAAPPPRGSPLNVGATPAELDESERSAPADRAADDEERLLDQAQRSRDETAELRKETEEARAELEDQRPSRPET